MSENREIARAAGIVGALTLASRISGLVRDAVTSHVFGTGMAADAFFVAFRLPNLLRRLVGEGAVSVSFIPVFGEYLGRGEAETERVFRAVLTVFAGLVIGVSGLGIALAPWWLGLLAPGFENRPEVFALTVELTRWLFPYLVLVSLVAVLGGLLNTLRHFAAPAASPVLLNLAMIAAVLALANRLPVPIYSLVAGVLLGGVLQLAIQVVPLRRMGISVAPAWEPHHPAVRRVLALLAPSALGAAVYQINLLLSTSLASVLAAGSVSYLWYAGRVFELPIGLVAVALGTAALPSFAAQAARGALADMRRSLDFAVGLTTLVAVPASVAIVVLAVPITAVLFQHGAFGAADAIQTARALQAYAVGLWPLAIVRILVPAFYALRDVRAPVVAALIALAVNALASLALIGHPVPAGSALTAAMARAAAALSIADFGHSGLALATSIGTAANLIWLVPALGRRLGGFDVAAMAGSLRRGALAAVPMAVLIYAAAGTVDWTAPEGLLFKAVWLAVIVGAGLIAFVGAALAVGGPEVDALRRIVRDRLGADAL